MAKLGSLISNKKRKAIDGMIFDDLMFNKA